MLDDKGIFNYSNKEEVSYVHTDEDRVTVPSSRVNHGGAAPTYGLKSHRGDIS